MGRVIAITAFIFGANLYFANARVIERILAVVNDEIIIQTDLDSYRTKLNTGGLIDDAVLRISDKAALLSDRKALINHLIDERLLDSEVKSQGLEVPIEKVEQEIRSISRRNGISRENLKAALTEKGVNFSDYQEFIQTTLERQSLIEKEVSSKIKISEDDMISYYVNHMGDKNANVYGYTLSHILFLTNKGEKVARDNAQMIIDKLKSGTVSFDKLAGQFSEDPNFSQGGFLGTFKAGEMLPEIEAAVKGLAVNDITGIVKTKVGYHIVQVTKKTVFTNPNFEAKKDEIRGILFTQAFKSGLRQWLDSRRKDAFIRINPS